MWTLLVLGTSQAAPEMIPEEDLSLVGRTAPTFELTSLEGDTVRLEDLRGKPVVLSFWASWCGPCRLELPALDKLQKSRDDITIVAVNVDREAKDAKRFMSQVKFDLPVVLDNDARVMGQFGVYSMPTMFLLDENGTVKFMKVGFGTDKGLSELEAALEKL